MPRETKTKRRSSKQRASGALKGFAEASKARNLLLSDIRQHTVVEGIKNGDAHRSTDRIHISELLKDEWCERRAVYKLTGTEQSDPKTGANFRSEILWAAGHVVHDKWQRWLQEMGDLWGLWKCGGCRFEWEDISPEECPRCGAFPDALRYEEVVLTDEEYPLIGHADAAVPRLNALVEFKSFAPGSLRIESPDLVRAATVKTEDGKTLLDDAALWKSIQRPLKSHVLQGLFYLWIANRLGMQYDKVIFIYEWKTNQDTKEFVIPLSDRRLQPYLEVLDRVMAAVEEGVVPPRPEGFERDRKPCKDCPFKTLCWGETGDDESQATGADTPRRRRTRSQAADGASAAGPSPEASRRRSRASRGSDRVERQRSDAPVREDDEVGGLPRRSTGSSGSGREVGRVRRRATSSTSEPEEPREERQRAEGSSVRRRRVRSG